MGGFVAAVPRGAPATAELIERVIAASRDRAPDGVRHVVTPEGVLLVQCMFANTPESVGEQLPKSDPSGRVWIVKRGHLTNIDELRGRLRDRLGADVRVHTDADVMLAAYLAWGPDMAGRVEGEFTLAIWDGRDPSLFVLRDHLGRRGCYTHDGDEWYVAASEPAQVLPFPGVSDSLDEMSVVDYISGACVDRVRTFYEGIGRPWPATAVRVRDRQVRHSRYWVPSLSAEPISGPPERWHREVFELFEASVQAALRSPTAVACDLSGGLDSSAVLAMAVRTSALNPGKFPEISAHSHVYPGRDCDESTFIEAVLQMWPVPHHAWSSVDGDQPDPDRDWRRRSLRWLAVDRSPAVRRQDEWMQANGVRVRLAGSGGDEIFHSSPLPINRHLRTRDPIGLYMWWTCRRSLRMAARRVRSEVLRPALPPRAVDAYRHIMRRPQGLPGILSSRAFDMHAALRAEQPSFEPRQAEMVEALWGAGSHYGIGINDANSLRSGFETRVPLLDASFVTSITAMPLLLHRRGGRWRALQKQSLASLYPDVVAARFDKADFSHEDIEMSLRIAPLHSELCERGLIDPASSAHARLQVAEIARGVHRSIPWDWIVASSVDSWLADCADGPAIT